MQITTIHQVAQSCCFILNQDKSYKYKKRLKVTDYVIFTTMLNWLFFPWQMFLYWNVITCKIHVSMNRAGFSYYCDQWWSTALRCFIDLCWVVDHKEVCLHLMFRSIRSSATVERGQIDPPTVSMIRLYLDHETEPVALRSLRAHMLPSVCVHVTHKSSM